MIGNDSAKGLYITDQVLLQQIGCRTILIEQINLRRNRN